MRFLDKLILTIFSIIIIVLSVVTLGIAFHWINIITLSDNLDSFFAVETNANIVIGISILVFLLALKGLFFKAKDERATRDGILLQNDNGQLLISRETLENLVNGVAYEFEGTENVVSRVGLDRDNNLKVYVTLYVRPNVIIKDLTTSMQKKIKETIKRTSDIEPTQVNVRIKNIAPKEHSNINK